MRVKTCLLICTLSLPALAQDDINMDAVEGEKFDSDSVHLLTMPYPPYTEIVDGRITGTSVENIRCAFEAMPEKVAIHARPFNRAKLLTKQGKADGFFSASHKKSRDAYATHSGAIETQNWTFFQLKDSPFDPESEEFKQEAVTTSFLGSNMHSWLQSNGYKVTGNPPTNSEQLLSMLIHKRIDAFLMNEQAMDHAMTDKQRAMTKRKVIHSHNLGVYFGHHFLRHNPGFLERFNSALAVCTEGKFTHRSEEISPAYLKK
ncbi:substrate-binding periplasmic protein [Neptuniibacter sp. QD37_6]|uniref:substrate-binding periplasmic protein n=1 Tax=Neptuniibacter sp. QD37_6 TaxID=3398210 RepID=UPI0039F57F11